MEIRVPSVFNPWPKSLAGATMAEKEIHTMNAEAIREWLTAQPFRPFELHLSNGEVYEVRHPELVAMARTHLALADPAADRIKFIALMHINSIGALQTA